MNLEVTGGPAKDIGWRFIKSSSLQWLIHGLNVIGTFALENLIGRHLRWSFKLVCIFDGLNTLRTGSFKLFKRPLPGFLTILTL